MLLRKEKTCPHCRAVVSEAPVESWAVKDTVGHLFSRFDVIAKQLYPGHERPAGGSTVPGPSAEAWNGVFKPAPKKRNGLAIRLRADENNAEGAEERNGVEGEGENALGFWDEEDDVWRCSECLHEIWEGTCSECGRQYIGHANTADGDGWFTEDEVAGGLWFDHGLDGDWHDEDANIGDDRFEDPDDDDDHENDMGVLARMFGRRPQFTANPRDDDAGYESSFIDDEDDETQNEQRAHDDDDDEYHSAEDDDDAHADHSGDDRSHLDRARRSMDARGRTRMPGGLDLGSEGLDDDDDEHEQAERAAPASGVPHRRVLRLIDSEDESQNHSSDAENAREGTNTNTNGTANEDDEEEEDDVSPHWSRSLIPRLRNRFGTLLSDSDEASESDQDGGGSDDQQLTRREQRFISDRGYVRSSQENLTDSEDDDLHVRRRSRLVPRVFYA